MHSGWKLNLFGGDFVKAAMMLAFISSPEYRGGFGQPSGAHASLPADA